MSVPLDSPALALRAAIHAALVTDAALVALLGAPRIHDVPPGDADFPFVTLGEAVVADWSTATEAGTEQALTLHVFSRSGGRAEAFAIAARLQAVLHDAALALKATGSPICVPPPPRSAARATGAPSMLWCGSAPSPSPFDRRRKWPRRRARTCC